MAVIPPTVDVKSAGDGWLVTTPDGRTIDLDNSEDFFNFVLSTKFSVWRGDVRSVYSETEQDNYFDFNQLTESEIQAEMKYEALVLAAWDKSFIYPGQENVLGPKQREQLIWRTSKMMEVESCQ